MPQGAEACKYAKKLTWSRLSETRTPAQRIIWLSARARVSERLGNVRKGEIMARQEQDREDILREATALVERVELLIPEFPEPIVAGFRRDGSASFFFGADPVLQFNAQGKLRRAF